MTPDCAQKSKFMLHTSDANPHAIEFSPEMCWGFHARTRYWAPMTALSRRWHGTPWGTWCAPAATIRCCGSGPGAALVTGRTATRPPCGSRRPARVHARPPLLQSIPRLLIYFIYPLDIAGAYTANWPFAAGERMLYNITSTSPNTRTCTIFESAHVFDPQVRRPRPSLRRLSLLALVLFPASEPQCLSSRQLHLVSDRCLSSCIQLAGVCNAGAPIQRPAAVRAAGFIAVSMPFGHLLIASERGITLQCSRLDWV